MQHPQPWLVRELGAAHAVDHTREDVTAGPRRFDVIVDNVGNRRPRDHRRVLRPDGRLVQVGPLEPMTHWLGVPRMFAKVFVATVTCRQEVRGLPMVQPRQDDLRTLTALIDAGEVRPVIERTYELAEAADAIRHVEPATPAARSSSPSDRRSAERRPASDLSVITCPILSRMASTRSRRARAARRRKRRMDRVEHDLSAEQWAALTQAWGGGCAYCGATDGSLQRDCVLPLSRGGRYTLDNIVPACRSCNASKCNHEVTGWLRRRRLDERAFLLRHAEVNAALAPRFPTSARQLPEVADGAPAG